MLGMQGHRVSCNHSLCKETVGYHTCEVRAFKTNTIGPVCSLSGDDLLVLWLYTRARETRRSKERKTDTCKDIQFPDKLPLELSTWSMPVIPFSRRPFYTWPLTLFWGRRVTVTPGFFPQCENVLDNSKLARLSGFHGSSLSNNPSSLASLTNIGSCILILNANINSHTTHHKVNTCVYLSVHLSDGLSVSVCLSLHPTNHLSFCLSVCLSVCLCECHNFFLCVNLFEFPSF